MTTAFVLSGGGNLGCVQVGMLRTLVERGVVPDLIVGTSVGSLNGAWLAVRGARADVGELESIWRQMRRQVVFPAKPLTSFNAVFGRKAHLVPANGLRRVIEQAILGSVAVGRRLEDTAIEFHVVATDIRTGHDVLLSRGDLVDSVCASAAIPGVFPIVEIDGQSLVDGGVVNNCPISHAVALGASEIWALPCGYACSLPRAPSGALETAVQAISLLVQHRLVLDVERYRDDVELHVFPTLCPVKVGPLDFGQSESLMRASYSLSSDWFDDRTVGQRPGLHRH